MPCGSVALEKKVPSIGEDAAYPLPDAVVLHEVCFWQGQATVQKKLLRANRTSCLEGDAFLLQHSASRFQSCLNSVSPKSFCNMLIKHTNISG